MTFSELASHRQSTRSYQTDKDVAPDIIKKCLEITRLAPSSRNWQPYHFTITSGQMAKRVAPLISTNLDFSKIPVFVIISKQTDERDYRELDIGIAAAYFTLAATELNLGTCMLGGFNESGLQQLLELQNHITLVIAVGYVCNGIVNL